MLNLPGKYPEKMVCMDCNGEKRHKAFDTNQGEIFYPCSHCEGTGKTEYGRYFPDSSVYDKINQIIDYLKEKG